MSDTTAGGIQRPVHHNELVLEIGSLLLADPKLENKPWESLALVVSIGSGAKRMSGFWYQDEHSFQAFSPKTIDVLRRMSDLQKAMEKEDGKPWQQCLLSIVKPELDIDIEFEYNDPLRWSAKTVSLDRSDYAESLRPKR